MCQPSHDTSKELRGCSRPVVAVGYPTGRQGSTCVVGVNFLRGIPARRAPSVPRGARLADQKTRPTAFSRAFVLRREPGVSKEGDAYACSRLCWIPAAERRFWISLNDSCDPDSSEK